MMTIEEVVVCFTVGNGTTTDATFELIQSESFNRYLLYPLYFGTVFVIVLRFILRLHGF